MHRIKNYSLTPILVGILTFCTNDHIKPKVNSPSTYQTDTNNICFSKDVLPIITSNCATSGCHDNVSKQGGFALTTYSIIVKNTFPGNGAGSILYLTTDQNYSPAMPPSPYNPLTDLERKIIKKWIDAGAKESLNCQ